MGRLRVSFPFSCVGSLAGHSLAEYFTESLYERGLLENVFHFPSIDSSRFIILVSTFCLCSSVVRTFSSCTFKSCDFSLISARRRPLACVSSCSAALSCVISDSLDKISCFSHMYKHYFVEQVEAHVVLFSLFGLVWRFVIQNTQGKTSCSLLNRILKCSLMRWTNCGQPNIPLCENY